MDAAKLTRKDEALVRTTAGKLHDEMKVVNALLELADQLEGKPGFPIAKGEPELPDEDEYLVQKKGRDRDSTPSSPWNVRSQKRFHRSDRDRRAQKYKKFRQVFRAILEDEDEMARMPPEAFAEDYHDPSSSGSSTTSEEAMGPSGEEEDSSFMPAEVFAAEYKAKKRVNELKQMRQLFKNGQSDKTKTWVKEQQKKEPCFLCGKLGHWSRECPDRS